MIELWLNAGLSNRMKLLASGLALSRAAGQRLTVYWFKNSHLNCAYRGLFEPIERVRVRDVETERLRFLLSPPSLRYHVEWKYKPHDLFLGNKAITGYRADKVDLASVVKGMKRCIIFTYYPFYEETASYKEIRPKKKLLAEVERFSPSAGAGRVIGVHIRGTDNAEAAGRSPVELFVERMQREVDQDPGARFFLATDDAMTERTVTGRFPGRVMTRPKEFDRERAAGVRDALVDLLVLSRCSLILGSYWSSFTEMAAELGGARVEIVDSDTNS